MDCLLCDVRAQTIPRGVIVGGVVASATTGALIALGHRAGGAGLPFAAIGAGLLHVTPGGREFAVVVTGVVLHVAMMLLWSAIFVWLVDHARFGELISALLIAIGHFVMSWAVASATGAGAASVLPLGDRLVLAVVLFIALVSGMRFAFLSTPSPLIDRNAM
jgi:hypothetical protein